MFNRCGRCTRMLPPLPASVGVPVVPAEPRSRSWLPQAAQPLGVSQLPYHRPHSRWSARPHRQYFCGSRYRRTQRRPRRRSVSGRASRGHERGAVGTYRYSGLPVSGASAGRGGDARVAVHAICGSGLGSVPDAPRDPPTAVGGVPEREVWLRRPRPVWLRWPRPVLGEAAVTAEQITRLSRPRVLAMMASVSCYLFVPSVPPLSTRFTGPRRYRRWRRRGVGDLHRHGMRGIRGLPSGLSSTIRLHCHSRRCTSDTMLFHFLFFHFSSNPINTWY